MFPQGVQINPIFRKGHKDKAVILVHGFTGTPDLMRPLANHLYSKGFTVYAPLLAGHGSTKEKLAKTTWKDWYKTVQDTYLDFQQKYSQIHIVGLSLGGLLTLKLAEDYDQIKSIACLATPIFLQKWVHAILPLVANTPLKYLYPYQKKVDIDVKNPQVKKNIWTLMSMPISCIYSLTELQGLVRKNLSKITIPTLLMHSRYDSTAPFESMSEIAKRISSKTTETIALENSFHLITVDYDKALVNEKVTDFFLRKNLP